MLVLLLIPLLTAVRADPCPSQVCPGYGIYLELLQSQLEFSVDLLQTVVKQEAADNVFLSPSSVYNALLITYFSAGGNTTKTLLKTLHINDKYTKALVLGVYSGNVMGNDSQCNDQPKEVAPKKYELSNANRMYVSDELKVQECMEKLFPKEIQQANFTGDAAGAIKQINSWVAEQTKDMIPKLLADKSLDYNTTIALVNAVYFNASWESHFSDGNTKKDQFYLTNGSTVPVEMMSQITAFRTSNDSQLEAAILELPYKGGEVSMFIVLPNKPSVSAISDLLNKITKDTVRNAYKRISEAKPEKVEVIIPKFTVEREYDLRPILSSMGAGALFNGSANFSTLFEDDVEMVISAAIHKTKIKVTQNGTEAAGATAINVLGHFPMPLPPVPKFRADHPFIYTIYDKPVGILLFTGIFNSP